MYICKTNNKQNCPASDVPSIYIRTCEKKKSIHRLHKMQEHMHVLKLYACFLSGCKQSYVYAEAFLKPESKIRNLSCT